uniref:Pcd11x n=1 Tax=Platynereis dumerilii TaxID=6359 RepID=A0A2H5BFB8_PLADU|nr:Pcd11x [Platynereis dumerilii]
MALVLEWPGILLLLQVMVVALMRSAMAQDSQLELTYSILEEDMEGTFVGNVLRDSRIQDRYSKSILTQLEFRFIAKPRVPFLINKSTGVIRTDGRIDRDALCPRQDTCRVILDVVAFTPGQTQFLEIIKVKVNIEDINDNWPHFPDARISHQILESAVPGYGFVIPTAIDPDSGQFSVRDYELVSSSDKFELSVKTKLDGSTDVRLILKDSLDREDVDFYQVRVVAYDGGNPPKSGSVDVNIIVQDANDNDPMFTNATYEVTIAENAAPGTTLTKVHASDKDAGLYGQIRYSFSSRTQDTHGAVFGIKNTTGEIYVKGEVDYETSPVYHLVVLADDRGSDTIPAEATVIVRVLDVNDNAPLITVNTLTQAGTEVAEVVENADPETFVAHLTVTDPDNGKNGKFNCSLNDDSFRLQQFFDSEYKIVTRKKLDRETHDKYNLSVLCQDFGDEPLVAIKRLQIIVTDDNDHAPVFSQSTYEASLTENNHIGVFITRVNATDKDSGENGLIDYKLHPDAGGDFHVDGLTGTVSARAVLDREQTQQIRFRVIASDRGQPRKSGTATVIVNVQDVNDEKPMFAQSAYSFGVYENEPEGTSVGTVHAVDPDTDPYNQFQYSILPGHSAENSFAIDPHTGKITTTTVLDREDKPVYYLLIMASDKGVPPMSSTATVSIYVADKNDNPPVFEFPSDTNNTISISNQVPKGYLVTKVKAIDRDIGGNANLTYYISRGNHLNFFHMDPIFGVITVSTELKDIEDHVFHMQLKVSDSGQPEKYAFNNLNIVVNKSIPFQLASTGHILGGHNFTIVVSLACVSGVIMVCLVIAIVVIRRQDTERRNHKYNCRMEALKMLHATRENHKEPEMESTSSKALSNGSCSSDCDKPAKKEVSFNLDMDDRDCVEYGHVNDRLQRSWPSTIDHKTLETPQACSSMLTTASSNGSDIRPSRNNNNASRQPPPPNNAAAAGRPPWPLTQRELEVHQLLQMLKDQDADSAYSGDGSNTDSGRGPSEEGEPDKCGGGRRLAHSPQDEGLQVVPQLSANNSLNVSQVTNNQSIHSYSQQPLCLQTFAPAPRPGEAATLERRGQLNTGFIGTTPGGTDISPIKPSTFAKQYSPDGKSPYQQGPHGHPQENPYGTIQKKKAPQQQPQQPPAYGGHNNAVSPYSNGHYGGRGYHSDAETEETLASDDDGAMQYSCADMSDGTYIPTPRSLQVADNTADDATTTSGSYVVDPQDLCQEIDDLFFRDMVV